MQDLGRIVIDINEKGHGGKAEGESGLADGAKMAEAAESAVGEGVGEAAAEISALGSVAAGVSAAFAGVAVAVGAIIKVVDKVVRAMTWMHEQIMSFANDIAEFSVGIQVAEMENELKMMATKFKVGASVGSYIGAYMKEVGALERTMVELKGLMAGIFAIALRPILAGLNRLVDWLEGFLVTALESIGKAIMSMGSPTGFGFSRSLYDIGRSITQIAQDARGIKNNTAPTPDFSDLNRGFLNDLRLMGATSL